MAGLPHVVRAHAHLGQDRGRRLRRLPEAADPDEGGADEALSFSMSDVSYEAPYSAGVARKSGSNFYWSFFFLPKAKKNAIFVVYAFSRLVDDAVDEASDETKAREEIGLWRRRLAACYGEGD